MQYSCWLWTPAELADWATMYRLSANRPDGPLERYLMFCATSWQLPTYIEYVNDWQAR